MNPLNFRSLQHGKVLLYNTNEGDNFVPDNYPKFPIRWVKYLNGIYPKYMHNFSAVAITKVEKGYFV